MPKQKSLSRINKLAVVLLFLFFSFFTFENATNGLLSVSVAMANPSLKKSLSAPVLNSAVGGNHQVTLKWSAVPEATGYKIYFHSSAERFWRIVYTDKVTLHTVRGLRSGTTYYFKVSAVNAGGESPKSNEKTALTLPRAVRIHSAIGGINSVNLTWGGVVSAKSYKIYYGTSPQVYTTSIDVGDVTEYAVMGLAASTKYYFAVAGVNLTGEGRKSFPKEATTLPNSLTAPTLTEATGGVKQVLLNWSAVSGATGYKVYYRTLSGVYGIPIDVGNITQYSVIGLNDGTLYYFAVSAVNADTESPKSNEKSAATLPALPTVDITVDPTSITRGQSAALSWSSTDADTLIISPDIGTVAASGTMVVSPTTTTTYSITATGPGGTATKSVTLTVVEITPMVTLSANPQTIPSGSSTTLSWTSTNAASLYIDNGIGLVANSGTLTVSPKVTTTYTITATGPLGSANARVTVEVTGSPEAPPDGTFAAQYWYLIPTDSTVGQYDVKRFAVIRGGAHDKNNAPLTQVSIIVDGHPEYGTAKTDANGQFSLPVDINGTVGIIFKKEGFITTHRQVQVVPNDFVIAQTLTMLAEDTKATEVTLNGDANNVIVHQSTPVTDVSGTRKANVVIAGDNRAYAVDKNGNDMFELTRLNVRATEFATPESMPAVLPPTSAFTYCAEFKVDGVERVRFKDPVITYVDNFLGFDVGEIVPVGYFDRDRGVWVPSENGRVVKLLDTNSDGIVDALDANGDGNPDDLNDNGDFTDEVKGLNDPAKYAPNKTFWRASFKHFTPWDLNWPIFISADAIPPNATGTTVVDQQKKQGDDCDKAVNSYVNCRSRIYHEDIDIPGTDLTLHYASNRVPDYKTIITVPASGTTVPPSLKKIVVRLNIAGHTFEQTLPVAVNQTAEFSWDGLDYLGQRMDFALAYITTEFVYDMKYSSFGGGVSPPVFGSPGVSQSPVPARDEYVYSKNQSFVVHNQSQTREGLAEGWTLSNHHFMSSRDVSTLFKGNGDVVKNKFWLGMITTIAGTGVYGYGGDGGPATEAFLKRPSDLTFDQSGNTYIADYFNHRIRKIDTNGIITTIAGTGTSGFAGDGGPATAANLYYPSDYVIGQNGEAYIVDSLNHRIRKIDANGIITTIAGTGVSGFSGDGGPATGAQLHNPYNAAIDEIGNIYVTDGWNHRVRKIDSNGIIYTFAGTGEIQVSGDGGPATAANIGYPYGLAIDQKGDVFVSTWNNRIRKIDTNGIISHFAGSHRVGFGGDGGPANQADLDSPMGLAVNQNNEIYFADTGNERIRKIDVNGIISTIAGTGVAGFSGDEGPAFLAKLNYPIGVAVDRGNNIYVADLYNNRIRKIEAPLFVTGTSDADMTFAEEGLGYVFSIDGKHKQTIDLDTQKVLEEFGYDAAGRLISAKDLFNNQLTIERNAAGVPTAIVSPDGVRTTLTIDANNHLTHITYPDGKFYKFDYTAGGLMTKETEPKGNFFTHTFDANGRITDVNDQEGGHEKFDRQVAANSGDITTTVTSGEGDIVTYLDQISPSDVLTSTISVSGVTKPTISSRTADELTSKITQPDLTVNDLVFDLDPENKFKYLKSQTITTPAGLKAQVVYNRTYTDTNSDEKKDLIVRTASLNTKTATVTNDTIISTMTATSPLSRTVTAVYDPTTLLTSKVSVPGLLDTAYTYDFKGRPKTITTGTRTMSLDYDLAGNVQSVTDPRGNRTSYTYDTVGRTKLIHRPDATEVRFDYDANGNMTVLTNPSSQNHGYIYNNVNLATTYTPPISPSTTYVYDKERRLKEVDFPSGKKIQNIYTGVLLTQMQTPEGNVDLAYLPSGQLASVTKGGESIANTYDGGLLKTVTSAGTLAQTLAFTFNNDFRLFELTYAGTSNNFAYDDDGLLTSSGRFTITRNAQNGLPTVVTGGVLNLSRVFSGYAEVTTQTQTVNSVAAGSWTLTYNNNGQIATKSETAAGITADHVYTYDEMGRLTKVEKDGTLVEEYRYTGADPLGTRTFEFNSLRGIPGRSLTYNEEDQLLSVGSITYQYDADGFLSKKTDGAAVTNYTYSSRGELLSAALPSGQVIEYVHDPMGRRIAKKINGATVEKYLWAGLTQLLAVYDGADTLLMRFEYSDGRMPQVMTKGSATYYLTYDQVGSLRAVTDSTGAIVKRIDYDSFGNIIADTAPAFTVPFGFAGGLHDRDVALVRFGFRDYDPATGRWTAKDPIGFAGGDVDLYGYVLNDPVNLVDPYGLCPGDEDYVIDTPDYKMTREEFDELMSIVMGTVGGVGGRYSKVGKSKYWQYFTKGWKDFKSPWFVKGIKGKPPYKPGKEAREALNLPKKNKGTAVQPYNPEKIVGPRTPNPKPKWGWPNKGEGKEYFDGDAFPD